MKEKDVGSTLYSIKGPSPVHHQGTKALSPYSRSHQIAEDQESYMKFTAMTAILLIGCSTRVVLRGKLQ